MQVWKIIPALFPLESELSRQILYVLAQKIKTKSRGKRELIQQVSKYTWHFDQYKLISSNKTRHLLKTQIAHFHCFFSLEKKKERPYSNSAVVKNPNKTET